MQVPFNDPPWPKISPHILQAPKTWVSHLAKSRRLGPARKKGWDQLITNDKWVFWCPKKAGGCWGLLGSNRLMRRLVPLMRSTFVSLLRPKLFHIVSLVDRSCLQIMVVNTLGRNTQSFSMIENKKGVSAGCVDPEQCQLFNTNRIGHLIG